VYGWFERTERGVYRLTDLGEAALLRWSSIMQPPSGGGVTRLQESVGATPLP